MFVWATRTVSILALRALFYIGLFLFVVVLQVAVTSGLRALGLSPSISLLVSGVVVLVTVLSANFWASRAQLRFQTRHERARAAQGLPDGPCCVLWKTDQGGEAPMPWSLTAPIRAPYPRIAKRFGVEGLAIVDFEVGADGAPKHFSCVDVWPSDVFYKAAVQSLREARFEVKPGAAPRFGASYRMPFVFRIAGAARLKDRGKNALPHRPVVMAAVRAAEQLAKRA